MGRDKILNPISERLCMTVKNVVDETGVLLSSEAIVVHRSLWAITIKDGNFVYKFYYYHNREKIHKEVNLLLAMNQIEVELFEERAYTYLKMKYIGYADIMYNMDIRFLYEQIQYWINRWNTEPVFHKCIGQIWTSQTVPYMIEVLKEYIPNVMEYIQYLSELEIGGFVHGDFTLENVKIYDDKLLIFDFETACFGPVLWDQTTFIYSLIENKYFNLANGLFEKFGCDLMMLKAIAAYRLALSYKKNANIGQREQACIYIEKMQKEN